MNLKEIAQSIREAWDTLFASKPEAPSRYVLHLEGEVIRLRDENARLQIKLELASTPKPEVPKAKIDLSNYKPAKTKWEAYLESEIARQEQEAQEELELQEK
jgi:hypothetical protein